MAKRITNITKHAHQVLDGVMLKPGETITLTEKQEQALSSDDYYAALVVKEIIREDAIQQKAQRAEKT